MESPQDVGHVESFDFVVPFSEFECRLIDAVRVTYSPVLDNAMSHLQNGERFHSTPDCLETDFGN